MESIRESIKTLQSKKQELESIKKQIADKRTDFDKNIEEARNKFEESLEPLKESADRMSDEFNLLANNKVCVSLADLTAELSNLTGINVFKMGIKIATNVSYWGKHNKKEIYELINSTSQRLRCGYCNKDDYWTLKLYADKDLKANDKRQAFCYEMKFLLDLLEVQSDGKTLLDHCSEEINYDDMQGMHYTALVIDKNIESLNCDLSLNNLVQDEETRDGFDRWYPSDLLAKAFLNCAERKNAESKHNSSIVHKVRVKRKKI